MAPETFEQVASALNGDKLLPNLRQLVWRAPYYGDHRSLFFLHPTLHEFIISLETSTRHTIRPFFQTVAKMSPCLHVLDLQYSTPSTELEEGLIQLFASLPQLTKVALPAYGCTDKIMKQLSTLHSLSILHSPLVGPVRAEVETMIKFLEEDTQQSINYTAHLLEFKPQIDEDSFPALRDLCLSANLPGAILPFHPQRRSFVATLHALTLDTLSDSPLILCKFMTAVGRSCIALKRFSLNLVSMNVPLIWEMLHPLISLSGLTEVTVRAKFVLDITEREYEAMAKAWPLLQKLCLNPYPRGGVTSHYIDLHALVPFATHCPDLVHLALYLPNIDQSELAHTGSLPAFKSLRCLSFGSSPLRTPLCAAQYLGQICPPQCQLHAIFPSRDVLSYLYITNQRGELGDDLTKTALGCQDAWRTLLHILPLVQQGKRITRAQLAM